MDKFGYGVINDGIGVCRRLFDIVVDAGNAGDAGIASEFMDGCDDCSIDGNWPGYDGGDAVMLGAPCMPGTFAVIELPAMPPKSCICAVAAATR